MKNFTTDSLILYSIPILFLLAFVTHFIYEWLSKNIVVGLLFPANESVFEHTKLFTVTTFLFWIITYNIKKQEIDADRWFTAGLFSMVITIVLIPMLHYLYVKASGSESIFVDILIALIAVGIGQIFALHYYKYGTGVNAQFAIILMLGIIVIFALLTLFPPKTPIFKDSLTGNYGIS